MILPHIAYPCEGDKAVRITLQGGLYSGRQAQINCSYQQYEEAIRAYKEGGVIQDVFDFLTPGEREFLLTGMTQEEWDRMSELEDEWEEEEIG